jgi:L-lysine exporter family protein LysE/ArgO
MFDNSAFVQGFVLGLGMFVCPGPKDVLILRQALLRRSALELVSVGVLSDALLIWIGMAGVSVALAKAPGFQTVALWFGTFLLLGHSLFAARRSIHGMPFSISLAVSEQGTSRIRSFVALLTVSFLNPVAWLDTLLVVGTVGASMPAPGQVSFAFGATIASLVWFLFLVVGARTTSRLMEKRNAARVLDAFVALAMSGMALYIAGGLL